MACMRCRQPNIAPTTTAYTNQGGTEHRAAATCTRHQHDVRAWVAAGGGTVHEIPVHTQPDPQLDLYNDGAP